MMHHVVMSNQLKLAFNPKSKQHHDVL